MPEIRFGNQEKAALVGKLQRYFESELHQRLGQFDAEFLLDFVGREMGAYFYNRGLYDAQTILAKRLDELQDSILQLERPTEASG